MIRALVESMKPGRGLQPARRFDRQLCTRSQRIPARPTIARRRGSVLILVMTLLGILFVIGVAFLTSTNFEAKMITTEQNRDRSTGGVETVTDAMGLILQNGMMAVSGLSSGGPLEAPFRKNALPVGQNRLPAASASAVAELPGIHNFFAPIEPYQSSGQFKFRWFTDLKSLMDPTDQSLRGVEVEIWRPPPADPPPWTSGVRVTTQDRFNESVEVVPVDSDGDGIVDTFQFDLAELGISPSAIAQMAPLLNAPANPAGRVFLGMRIIAHGGLVNLNESHPTLIANVLDVSVGDLSKNFATFRHRPSQADPDLHRAYSPQLEEGLLRRRVLLPPRVVPPSLLQGNDLLNPRSFPLGRGDLATQLFPPIPGATGNVGFETVFEGEHRYWPFSLDLTDRFDPTDPMSPPLWLVRMVPELSCPGGQCTNEYDRRHLVTTVSYDDLLSRGARAKVFKKDPSGQVIPDGDADMRQRMIDANQRTPSSSPEDCVIPFEYADYPQTIPNKGCVCPNDPNCRFDPRKGRLQLSLPWLDTALATQAISAIQRQALIYDVFMMLVRNARGPYWDDIICSSVACTGSISCNPRPCPDDESCPADGLCHNNVTRETHRQALLSRTAASLTANLIDFMDADDKPTRVALRSFDFGNMDTVGWEFGSEIAPGFKRFPNVAKQPFVYGLERQPYITEVATRADNSKNLVGWAVELYNPYDADLAFEADQDEYVLIFVDDKGRHKGEFELRKKLRAERFTVFAHEQAGSGGFLSLPGASGLSDIYKASDKLVFRNGWTIYLVRRFRYPGEPRPTDIVVDQFLVKGFGLGKEGAELSPRLPGQMEYIYAAQRVVPDEDISPGSRWTAPIPDTDVVGEGHSIGEGNSLGNWNNRPIPTDPPLAPVEVNFANSGSFASAFPTTGTMLLLMRHANRSMDDFSETKDLAFTTWLDDTTPVTTSVSVGMTTVPQTVQIEEKNQIDNGRMPLFDEGVEERSGSNVIRLFAHHVDPASDPTSDTPNDTRDQPGKLMHLPWGQLVFDYFTALPLNNASPFANPNGDPEFKPAEDALPRVDLDGLRVHGRININAAPWKVLAGLPLMPANKIPLAFREKIEKFAQLSNTEAETIGNELAQGIVAYREVRAVEGSGDYEGGTAARDMLLPNGSSPSPFGRGWNIPSPSVRRGTGFLSVGELANVRHFWALVEQNQPVAGFNRYSFYRTDVGMVRDPLAGAADKQEDYVGAVAVLVALQDWVTIRSDVFTLYGTLRGEPDFATYPLNDQTDENVEQQRADDVDSRAVRFQETVDRLPMFLGGTSPTRIGERVVAKYIDALND